MYSHARVCKVLALDRYIEVQVQSGFVTLQELQTQLRPLQPTSIQGGTAAGEAKNGVDNPQFLGHTVTTTKRPRDHHSLPNRERCEDNERCWSSPAPQTEMVSPHLPELSGTVAEKLAALIEFGRLLHWPEIDRLLSV